MRYCKCTEEMLLGLTAGSANIKIERIERETERERERLPQSVHACFYGV